MKVLNEVNPSLEQILIWGYNVDLLFICQDEDLILHDPEYVSVLIELASDPSCPKQQYCEAILEYYTQFLFLCRSVKELNSVLSSVKASEIKLTTEWLKNWKIRLDFLYRIISKPVKLSRPQCQKIAHDLNTGVHSKLTVELINTFENGVLEFRAHFENYQQFFYIDPSSGNWKFSRYEQLSSFS